jgi:hypothetical protein
MHTAYENYADESRISQSWRIVKYNSYCVLEGGL